MSRLVAVRALFSAWKRDPWLGVLGGASVLWVVGMVPYLWVRKFRYVVANPHTFNWDFSYFYRAAERFAGAPLSLYADPEFLYPPPSVLVFVPWLGVSEAAACLAAAAANVGLMVGCSVLGVRLWERHAGRGDPGVRWTAVLLALASAPTFQAYKYVQVGPLVLLCGLGALAWLARRPLAAGLVLAGGFWLKLYPLALAPLGLLRTGRSRFAAGLGLGLVVLPLVLLPVIPASLYAEYAGERLPTASETVYTFALNQSLPAVLERSAHPASAFMDRGERTLRPGVGLATAVLGVLLFGGVLLAAARGRLGVVAAGYLVLALLPVLSSLGWEHTYVLALPLVQAALVAAWASGARWQRAVAGFAAWCFLLPMLPDAVFTVLVEVEARPLLDLLSARFPLALVGAAAILVQHERRRRIESGATFALS